MAETQGKQQGKKSIARNRSARHEYEIGETFECGLVLTGTEVKSLRERGCQLTDTFCLIRDGEAWIHGMHLHPYTNGGVWNVDPDRKRKLLLHRRQIDYLDGKLRTNVQLPNFDDFFTTFDVKEGDGMWRKPEDRVIIW